MVGSNYQISQHPQSSAGEDRMDEAGLEAQQGKEGEARHYDDKPIHTGAVWKDDVQAEPDGQVEHAAADRGGGPSRC